MLVNEVIDEGVHLYSSYILLNLKLVKVQAIYEKRGERPMDIELKINA